MKIRITARGVGVVILRRSDWPEGKVLDVPKQDGDYFLRHGFAERVSAETPEEPEEPKPETATAEPPGEAAVEPIARRRKGASDGE